MAKLALRIWGTGASVQLELSEVDLEEREGQLQRFRNLPDLPPGRFVLAALKLAQFCLAKPADLDLGGEITDMADLSEHPTRADTSA